jgi:hypothetical protein
MGEIATIGLDLAKSVFQVHGIDARGTVLARRQLRRVAWCMDQGCRRIDPNSVQGHAIRT